MTNSSRFSQVSDELLSAYLDQAVTAEEKALVEAAVTTDAEVAWRLETLRQTVALLKALPLVALPRSFVLTQAQLVETTETELNVVRPTSRQQQTRPQVKVAASGWQNFWKAWRAFWQIGNPLLRNAAAVSFALLLVLLVGDQVRSPVVSYPSLPNQAAASASQADNEQYNSLKLPAQQSVAAATTLPTQTPAVDTYAASQAAGQQAAPPAQETSALQEKSAVPIQGSQPESSSAVAQSGANQSAASPPPGEDNPVELAPNGPVADQMTRPAQGNGVSAAAADQQKAASNEAPVAAAAQTEPEQAQPTASPELSTAVAISPLATQVATLLTYSVGISTTSTSIVTATNAVTAEVIAPMVVEASPIASPTPTATVMLAAAFAAGTTVTPTIASIAPTMTSTPLLTTLAPEQSQPASQPLAAREPASERPWQLAQITSALLTLVLGSLWWRSRR